MTIIDVTAPPAPTTLHVRSVPGLPASIRLVTTPTSTLVIGAAPWRHARRLAGMPIFAGPCVYILTGEEARIGKTTGLEARFRDHRRAMPMPRIDEIVVIACPAFTSDTITMLEASLTTTARKAGVFPILGAPLKAPALDPVRDRDVAHWLREIPALLLGAGCTLLDPEFAPPTELRRERDAAIGSGAVREGWREDFPEGLTGHPATMHFALERGGLQARAAVNGPWTVLRAGSLLTAAADTSDQRCIAAKRDRLREVGLLEPAGSFYRLQRDIAVPSLTNGVRLACGTNGPASLWRAL